MAYGISDVDFVKSDMLEDIKKTIGIFNEGIREGHLTISVKTVRLFNEEIIKMIEEYQITI